MRTGTELAKTAALEVRKIRNAVNDIIEIYASSINARLSDAIKAVELADKNIPPRKSDHLKFKWIIKKAAALKVKPGKGRPKDLTKIHKFSMQALAKLRDRAF